MSNPEQLRPSEEEVQIIEKFKSNRMAMVYTHLGIEFEDEFKVSKRLNLNLIEKLYASLLIGQITLHEQISKKDRIKTERLKLNSELEQNPHLEDLASVFFPDMESYDEQELISTKMAKPVYDKFVNVFKNRMKQVPEKRLGLIFDAVNDLFIKHKKSEQDFDNTDISKDKSSISAWAEEWKQKLEEK